MTQPDMTLTGCAKGHWRQQPASGAKAQNHLQQLRHEQPRTLPVDLNLFRGLVKPSRGRVLPPLPPALGGFPNRRDGQRR
jgi:hypothetical protein